MAEFQEVMRQAARLCDYMDNNCTLCPLTTEAFCQSCANEMENFPGVEKAIMSWAAEHPVVYTTWQEWFDTFDEAIDVDEPIPADIAEKLGIEPKEG